MSQNRKSWKKPNSRRAKLWKKMNGDYEEVPTPVKTMLVIALLIAVILIPMFSYWSININTLGCPSDRVLFHGNCYHVDPLTGKPDPFAVLWNGQVPQSYSTNNGISGSIAWVSTTGFTVETVGSPQTTSITIANKGDAIILEYTGFGSGGCICLSTVTDSFGTSFTDQVDVSNGPRAVGIWTGLSSGSGSDTLTVTWNNNGATTYMSITVSDYSGVLSFGNKSTNSGTGGDSTATLTVSNTNNWVVEVDHFQSSGSTPTGTSPQSGQTSRSVRNSFGFDIQDALDKGPLSTGSQSFVDRCLTSCGTPGWQEAIIEMNVHTSAIGDCNGSTLDRAGYLCQNSGFNAGQMQLNPNATFPGIMLSKGAVDTSVCSAKACAFAFSFNSGSFTTGERWAWALTSNATLPIQSGYSPINDTSIALMVYCVKEVAATAMNCYVYMQRQIGQAPFLTAGDDFYPTCNYALTLFRCMSPALDNSGGSNGDNLVANYTGGNNGGTTQGQSYWCGGSVASGPDTCNVGGVGYIADINGGTISYHGYQFNQTLFPWFNIQSNYHVMYWEKAGGSSLNWATAQTSIGSIISYYVPPTSPASTTTDTGGFFGWVGRTFGGAVNTVITTISNAGSWVQNTALGPIGNVLQGLVSWMISQTVAFLNWVGSGFGFPNLGTSLLNFFSDLVRIITQVLINAATWITNTGDFILNSITIAVNIFTNTIVVGLLSFYTNQIITLISIILTVVTLFFSFVAPTNYLLLMDWIWGIMMVYIIGVSGFLWWSDLNVQIFTFVFKLLWKFIEVIWRGIVILKSFIPTEGGTPADLANPIPSKGPSGGSGSGGKPEVKKETEKKEEKGGKVPKSGFKIPPRGYGQGAKDGDPFAIVLMGIMIVIVLYWLSQAAFSPLTTVQTAGCYAWSTSCHVQNGITVGSINTTVFFAYLFNQQHGVFVIFTLFVPLVVIMFARWFMKNVVGEDKEESGNMFFNFGGETAERTRTRTIGSTGTSRRETLRRHRRRTES